MSAINNTGDVSGFAFTTVEDSVGFVLHHGAMDFIKPPGSVSTFTVGINSHGQVIGTYDLKDFTGYSFLATPE